MAACPLVSRACLAMATCPPLMGVSPSDHLFRRNRMGSTTLRKSADVSTTLGRYPPSSTRGTLCQSRTMSEHSSWRAPTVPMCRGIAHV